MCWVILCGIVLDLGAVARDAATVPRVHPQEYQDCGVCCAYLVCAFLGVPATLQQVTGEIRPQADGTTSFASIEKAMRAFGLHPVSLRLSRDRLASVPGPAILHLKSHSALEKGDHFLLFLGSGKDGRPMILDPPRRPAVANAERLERLWTGNALVACRTGEEARGLATRLGLSERSLISEPTFWTAVAMFIPILVGLGRRLVVRVPRVVTG